MATILIGASFSLVFLPLQVYVLDVYLGDSASALAVNTICRSLFAAAIPLFTTQMFMGMGIQWASTLLACIGILLAPSPFLLYKCVPLFWPVVAVNNLAQVRRQDTSSEQMGTEYRSGATR